MSLSVIAIMKNEKHNLLSFLKSFALVADEIILVDTGSDDGTVEAAKKLGFTERGRGALKLRHFKWRDDFAMARNFALAHAKCDWVMWADLDDTLETAAPSLINAFKKTTRKNAALGFQIASESSQVGVYNRFLQARMFPNIPGIKWERAIHEKLIPSLEKLNLELVPIQECVILHSGYKNDIVFKNKMLRNAKILEGLKDEQSFEKYYQLGDAYFGANVYDLGFINYHKARELAENNLQKISATDRIIFGCMLLGEKEQAKVECEWLPENTPERDFWTGEILYMTDKKEESIPYFEKVLQYEYEPTSMTSFLDGYKDRAIRIIKKVKGENYVPAFAEQLEEVTK